jgi:hypothetical protein
MKINIICPGCSTGGIAEFTLQTLRNDNVYGGSCTQGHELVVVTQTLRHELLFEIALNAIRDGYYREAVASFAASTERFFEFAMRVICRSHSVEPDLFARTWNLVQGSSERQLGAYLLLYAAHFSDDPPVLSKRMVECRNRVVHKGELPDRLTAVTFGKAAYDVIGRGVTHLRDKCINEVNAVLADHVAAAAKSLGDLYPRTFMVTPTALNIISPPTCAFDTLVPE